MINIVKQNQIMHNIIMYLINLNLQFIFSPTCFGNNFAIINGSYIKLYKTVCIKMWHIKPWSCIKNSGC
jgi:hypothetical protein